MSDIILSSVVNPRASLNGYEQDDLGDIWWTMFSEMEPDEHPLFLDDSTDPNGADGTSEKATLTRLGNLQLLGGVFGAGEAERTITVEQGSSFFFPLLNWVYYPTDALNRPIENIGQPGGDSEEFVWGLLKQAMKYTTPFAKIDGVEVPNILKYRQDSDAIFETELPVDNIWSYPGTPSGDLTISLLADGFWLGLQALSPETHTFEFGGTYNDPKTEGIDATLSIKYKVSYDLNEIVGNDRDNKYSVRGTSKWDEIRGLGGNDYIVGYGGNDALYGDAGSDTLVGSGSFSHHWHHKHSSRQRSQYGEIDIMYGGEGADVFVLGDRHNSFYTSRGMGDYAIIKDFTGEDTIRLRGSRHAYRLSEDYDLGGQSGTAIFKRHDLVAFVKGASDLSLRSNDFSFV